MGKRTLSGATPGSTFHLAQQIVGQLGMLMNRNAALAARAPPAVDLVAGY